MRMVHSFRGEGSDKIVLGNKCLMIIYHGHLNDMYPESGRYRIFSILAFIVANSSCSSETHQSSLQIIQCMDEGLLGL